MSVVSGNKYYIQHETGKWLNVQDHGELVLNDSRKLFTIVGPKSGVIVNGDPINIRDGGSYIEESIIVTTNCGQHEERIKDIVRPGKFTESCGVDGVIGGMEFHHEYGKHKTSEEKVGAECCGFPLSDDCVDVGPIGKGVDYRTALECPDDYVITDMSWAHNSGQEEVHQEAVGIRCCRPKGRVEDSFFTDEQRKDVRTVFHCPDDKKAMVGMVFRHDYKQHGTHQEFAQAKCARVTAAKMVVGEEKPLNIKITFAKNPICINTLINLNLVYNDAGKFFNIIDGETNGWKLIPEYYYHCDENSGNCTKVKTESDTQFNCDTSDYYCKCWSGEEKNRVFNDYRCGGFCHTTPPTPPTPKEHCKNDKDCPENQKCSAGRCRPVDCSSDYSCFQGEVCISGLCVKKPSDPVRSLPIILSIVGGSVALILLVILTIRFFKRRRLA